MVGRRTRAGRASRHRGAGPVRKAALDNSENKVTTEHVGSG
jgi:hypothetical protein